MVDVKESDKVEVGIEVNNDGNPTNFIVLRESIKVLKASLIAIIERYGTWEPAILDGTKVGCTSNLQVELKYDNGGIVIVNELKNGFLVRL